MVTIVLEQHIAPVIRVLKMEMICFSKMLVIKCRETQHHYPDDHNPNFHICENLKSNIKLNVLLNFNQTFISDSSVLKTLGLIEYYVYRITIVNNIGQLAGNLH
jgi:hypothetical protein